ncbi:hypothetical protein [Leptolyngbya sp. FACHB-711]|uniref:hypothetical protein n=1 Tax=unclassified Leptolyngbya TaxID=2650499 RepID=UPI0016887597|nr:hypothetical protein [Leptolyngbya sp. FACHB-711]MBD1848477.1 hypothetical protein [Cyanobacteria bacterium FACHB-502]MBD2024959.1 hypothetical protein [Leptolyngbya sp. FACHB-711]
MYFIKGVLIAVMLAGFTAGFPVQARQVVTDDDNQVVDDNNATPNGATITPPQSAILSVPCVNGGGSGGWMYQNLPEHYFPIGLITVNEWSPRSIPEHSMYDPEALWSQYGTCIIVPARYP